jgi:hypothetical protein
LIRLVELHPTWTLAPTVADGVVVYTGISFWCPCWLRHPGKKDSRRIACSFENAIEAVMPKIDGWTGWPRQKGWLRRGETFETLSLLPSVNAGPPHWHGCITSGDLVTSASCTKFEPAG